MNAFSPAEILLPRTDDMAAWAVVACDQYTSEPEYWQRVDARTAGKLSARHLILPEAELSAPDVEEKIAQINLTMRQYLDSAAFQAHPDTYVYVERQMSSGKLRRGLIGKVDLEQYDYAPGSASAIRATEGTVLSRIPPRLRVREHAPLELPHVLLLADDPDDALLSPIAAEKAQFRKLYDFDLMEGGGHITGWLLPEQAVRSFDRRLEAYTAGVPGRYPDLAGSPMAFAVGDGNHSLATAKACSEALKAANPGKDLSGHPARWALVELENIHDPALEFEPIHRVITHTDPEALLAALQEYAGAEEGYAIPCVTEKGARTLHLDPRKGELAVGVLQSFLDGYLAGHPGEIDYIHGEQVTRRLSAAPDAVGFLLPPMEKRQLFRGVIADGALPRKTFSMGHAQEKRFYLEGRRIVDATA